MELPISMLVVIVIAVVILLGLLVLFMGAWQPAADIANMESAKSTGCRQLLDRGCTLAALAGVKGLDIEVGGDGKAGSADDTLLKLCTKYYGCANAVGGEEACCLRVCGCSV
jgi:uncharacterized membrane protein